MRDDPGQTQERGGTTVPALATTPETLPDGLYREVFEGAAAGFAITALDGRVMRVNAAFAALVGRAAGDVRGRLVPELVHPADAAWWEAAAGAALDGFRERSEFESRFPRPDGRVVTAWLAIALIRDDRRRPVCFTVQLVDVTARRVAESEAVLGRARQRLILGNLPGTMVVLYDPDLRVVEADGLTGDASGVTREGVQGHHVREFFSTDDATPIIEALEAALEGTPGSLEYDTADGRHFHVETTPFVEDDRVAGVLTVWHDVTARRDEERARRDADRQFLTLFEHAPIGMVLVGLDGTFERANAAVNTITGFDEPTLRDLPPFSFVHSDDVPLVQEAFSAVGITSDTASFEHRIVRADGEIRWVQAQVTIMRTDAGVPRNMLAQVMDVTDRKATEDRWIQRATHDPLTGLLNRTRFDEELGAHLTRCRRYGATGAALFLDVDRFKAINDTHGHDVGDRVIDVVARTLSSTLRESDVVARLGGDEFAVLLPAADREQAVRVAVKVGAAIAGLRIPAGNEPTTTPDRSSIPAITASIGIRVLGDPLPLSAADALRDADRAMYAAKAGGRGRWAVHAADTPAARRDRC
ncbi:sensor domain-containing diguanylate cyclase [Patulibacter minatonensis]|uniref:sensor domain-containing diguanylate cyclase n=1 Tax=Patulibacter minatonensis TaxID=298163 RepID=UPI00047CC816|nr:sensor domain-containing diguanylate cyclase [Patulibacter minatonensis]